MSHTGKEARHSWRLRVGPSGNVNSFIGPFGEAIPPQKHADAPWIDEVWQMVAVPQEKQRQASQTGKSCFIHQAGAHHQRGGEHLTDPFYSPSIAKHCEGDTCYFASWGQHAHAPTPFHSRLLYYTRHRDCGDGVLEVTCAMHHDSTASETVNHLNAPWGGARATQLSDFLVSPSWGGAARQTELHIWGSKQSEEMIYNLNTLGGYSTLAEDLPDPKSPLPSGVSIRPVGACTESAGHTRGWKIYTIVCLISTTKADSSGCFPGCNLVLTNPITGKSARATGVVHWAHKGRKMCLWPVGTASEFSKAVGAGSTLKVEPHNGKPAKGNLALSFAHGTDKERSNPGNRGGSRGYFWAESRLRFGHTSQPFEGGRDYTAHTVNRRVHVRPGSTYWGRQCVVSGKCSESDARAKQWVGESYQGMMFPGDTFSAAKKVELHAEGGALTFGAAVGGSRCWKGAKRCAGSTAPLKPAGQTVSLPLFLITCGTSSCVGHDHYGLTPAGSTRRPYLCADKSNPKARPTRSWSNQNQIGAKRGQTRL